MSASHTVSGTAISKLRSSVGATACVPTQASVAAELGVTGHEVRLMSPEYVRPYVKAQKNDDRDAEAIAEAATRPTMRFVPVKSVAQSDVQALHRRASGWWRSGRR